MKKVLLVLVLGGMVIGTVLGAVRLWALMGEVQISDHGMLALAIGVLLSLTLGIGLMFLVFYSSRRGHDDDVGG